MTQTIPTVPVTTALQGPVRSHATELFIPRIQLLDGLAFAIAIFQPFDVVIIGRLSVSEMIIAIILPFLFLRKGSRLLKRLPIITICLLIFWLMSQITTDLVRGSEFYDYSRGWAKIGVTIINFCALFLLLEGNPKRLVIFALGLAIGGIIKYHLSPSDYALAVPWKFGYGSGITWLCVLFAVKYWKPNLGMRWVSLAIMILVSALNFYMGFRSLGGIALLAVCYLVLQSIFGTSRIQIKIKLRRLLLIGLMLAISGWGALQIYKYSVNAGWLGEVALQKYETQLGSEYGLFFGGRSEILVSSRAILESPILGHGSWGKNCKFTSLYHELIRGVGYYTEEINETCLIPTHSYLFGSWVEAGIFGAIFWMWILSLPVMVLTKLYRAKERFAPLIAFLSFLLVWDIFFSPYGGGQRIVGPFCIVLIMSYLLNERKSESQNRIRQVRR